MSESRFSARRARPTLYTAFVAALLLARPALAVQKFALAVYHFNIQYVQGGLIGFPDGVSMNAVFNMNDVQVQDAIVTQSLDPLLDMYARHPTWGADIEMQGQMVDFIAARHSSTLAKLQMLVASGQISVDSFHWADQFWLAYPRVDMERSHDMVVKSFAAANLPLGPSIFTQEGQFAIGMERFFRERGIRNAIVAGGVLGYTFSGFQPQAVYTLGDQPDVLAVAGDDMSDDLVTVHWDYHDDGELAMTGGLDPYVGTVFQYNPTTAAAYESTLETEETEGYQHVNVDTYVQKALTLGEKPQPLPQVIDGVWHHDVFLWMGSTGLWDTARPGTSADNACHTLAMQAHRKLREAENVVAALKTHAFDSRIAQAWQDLLLGEGSDGTGQNPWLGEREFSEKHSQAALDAANRILSDSSVAPHVKPPASPKLVDDPGPFQVITNPEASRQPHIQWQKRSGTSVWELTVSWDALPSDSTDPERYQVEVAFPRTTDDLIWCGALEDEIVRDVPLAGIAGTQGTLPDGGTETTVMIPAANGLIGLGSNRYVIKQTEFVHIAAQLPVGEEVVRFKDYSAVPDAITWKFVVFHGSEQDAVAEAIADNVDPVAVKVEPCGCHTSAADAGAWLFAVLGLRSFRSRRRR